MIEAPRIIAHRGYSAVAPENTLAAFRSAIEAGAKWIECDVRRTKDNEYVVLHDATLQRTTSGVGYLRNLEWNDAQRYDAGSWFSRDFNMERIPLLRELFATVPADVSLNLELKPARIRRQGYAQFVEGLLALIREHRREDSVLISSFSSPMLRMVRQADGNVRLGVLTHGNVTTKSTIRELRDLRADWFIHNIRTLRPSVVSAIQQEGFSVAAFTVNTPKQAAYAIQCGVDYIITNEVEKMRDWCAQGIANGAMPATQDEGSAGSGKILRDQFGNPQ